MNFLCSTIAVAVSQRLGLVWLGTQPTSCSMQATPTLIKCLINDFWNFVIANGATENDHFIGNPS